MRETHTGRLSESDEGAWTRAEARQRVTARQNSSTDWFR